MTYQETIWFEVQRRGETDWFPVEHVYGETDAMNAAGARDVSHPGSVHRIRECKCPGFAVTR